jgi:valyl-tRNA synthetase
MASRRLVIAQWPSSLDCFLDEDAEKQIAIVQDVIRSVRDIRNNRNIPPKKMLVVSAKSHQQNVDILNQNAVLIQQLAGATDFQAGADIPKPPAAAVAIADAAQIYVHDAIDPQAERARLQKQKQQIQDAKVAVEAKLNNENFIAKAKPQVVNQARDKLTQLSEQLKSVEKNLLELDA